MLVTEALFMAGLNRGVHSSVLQDGLAQANVIDPIAFATCPLGHMKDALGDSWSVFTLVRVTGAAGLNRLTQSVSLRCILLTRYAGCLIDYETKLLWSQGVLRVSVKAL